MNLVRTGSNQEPSKSEIFSPQSAKCTESLNRARHKSTHGSPGSELTSFRYRTGSRDLPLRTHIPTASHQQSFSSISLSHHHSLLPHTHTLFLSPSPSSFITRSFTLTSQWMPPIALQVPHSSLVPWSRLPAPRLPFIPHHSLIASAAPSSLCARCRRSGRNSAPLRHSCFTALRLFRFHTPSVSRLFSLVAGLLPFLNFLLLPTRLSHRYLLFVFKQLFSGQIQSTRVLLLSLLLCANSVCVWPKRGRSKPNFACCRRLGRHSFSFSSLSLVLPSPFFLSPFPLGVGTHSAYELTQTS